MIDPKKIEKATALLESMHDEATKTREGPEWSNVLEVFRFLLAERAALRSAVRSVLWSDIGHEWNGTGGPEERAIRKCRDAAPDLVDDGG